MEWELDHLGDSQAELLLLQFKRSQLKWFSHLTRCLLGGVFLLPEEALEQTQDSQERVRSVCICLGCYLCDLLLDKQEVYGCLLTT